MSFQCLIHMLCMLKHKTIHILTSTSKSWEPEEHRIVVRHIVMFFIIILVINCQNDTCMKYIDSRKKRFKHAFNVKRPSVAVTMVSRHAVIACVYVNCIVCVVFIINKNAHMGGSRM